VGFSGSKATEQIGAFFTGRRANGLMPAKPILVQAGRAYFDYNRRGETPSARALVSSKSFPRNPALNETPSASMVTAKAAGLVAFGRG
jgi:hypothetical protein